ncbi:beta-aspartyl-peptidase [Schnuerera sp. xch1]|uniref:beta-aspartyl-peptidase n=1 Tax=Schnuerera sp. xch1 TaxID=2874283 RepID=UPI001CC11407|nr:beta-aspartyl-peptidase [Schnuerera sp. xch1]MBZ2174001.1 beta-aspartyl-peptidase [Schnuerera sp. xch1]
MILIKNIEVYSPKNIGIKDVLITNGRITLIDKEIEQFNRNIKIIDGTGKKLIPGLIDNHVHITGGGGEGSFKTRVPEITLSKLIQGGITTVVGLLGTDSTTRSIENLVAKAKALKEEGISVYVHTGAYGYPTTTLTDSVKKDIVFIEEVIGVKIALSDHRSPSLSHDELARLASDARVAGMLSGKAGIVVVHMGDGRKGLSLINEVLEETEIPIRTFRPTHVNRKQELLVEAFDYAKNGGIIDLTCGISTDMTPAKVILKAQTEGVPLENITISSDGYGSWSKYDEYGNIIKIGASSVSSLYNELKYMVLDLNFDIENALKFYTTNVSKSLGIYPKKGTIQESSDADLIIIDENIEINTVISNGKIMFNDGQIIVKGTYE